MHCFQVQEKNFSLESVAIRKKLVVVGDGICGKTSLIFVFNKDQFCEILIQTIYENYTAEIEVENQKVHKFLFLVLFHIIESTVDFYF